MSVDGIGWSQVVANATSQGDARQLVIDLDADNAVASKNSKKTYLSQKVFSTDNQDRIRYKSTSEANRVTLENLKIALNTKFGEPVAKGVYQSLFKAKAVTYQKRNGDEVQTYRPVSAAEISLADKLAAALSKTRDDAIAAAAIAGDTAGVTAAHVDAAIKDLVDNDDVQALIDGTDISAQGLQEFRDRLGQKLAAIAQSRTEFEARFQTALLYLEVDNTQRSSENEGQTAREVVVNQRDLQLQGAPESRGKGRGVVWPDVQTPHDQVRPVDTSRLDGVSEANIHLRGTQSAQSIQRERKEHFLRASPGTRELEQIDAALTRARYELDLIPGLEQDLAEIRVLAASGLDTIRGLRDEIDHLEQLLQELEETALSSDDREALTQKLAAAQQVLVRLKSETGDVDALESERHDLDLKSSDWNQQLLKADDDEQSLNAQRDALVAEKRVAENRFAVLDAKKKSHTKILGPKERTERKRLKEQVPSLERNLNELDRRLQTQRDFKLLILEQKSNVDRRRTEIDIKLQAVDSQSIEIQSLEDRLAKAGNLDASADKLRSSIGDLNAELDGQLHLREQQRASFERKQQERTDQLLSARRIVNIFGQSGLHAAEQDAAHAQLNVYALTKGLIQPAELSVKEQEQALALLRIKVGTLNDFLHQSSDPKDVALYTKAQTVEDAEQQRKHLATLERQLLTTLQATRIDEFFEARQRVKDLSLEMREGGITPATQEQRVRAFIEAKDRLVDQRAQIHPIVGQGQITDVLSPKFVDSLSSDALTSSLIKAIENRPKGTPISKVIDARTKAWGGQIRQRIIENLQVRKDAVDRGVVAPSAFGPLEQEMLDYMTPSQMHTRLSTTLSDNGNSFAALFQRYTEAKSKVASFEEVIASRDQEIHELETGIQSNTNRNKKQKLRMGFDKFLGVHESKGTKRLNLEQAKRERAEAETYLAGQKRLLNDYRPLVAIIAEAANRVPEGLWDSGLEVREQLAVLKNDPYTHAVVSAAQMSYLASAGHNRIDGGGIDNIKRLLTNVPSELVTEFAGPKPEPTP